MEAARAAAKKFLYANLYESPGMEEAHANAAEIVQELFAAIIADPGLLPADHQAEIPAEGLARTVADYIAGMTDSYIEQLWERYAGVSPSQTRPISSGLRKAATNHAPVRTIGHPSSMLRSAGRGPGARQSSFISLPATDEGAPNENPPFDLFFHQKLQLPLHSSRGSAKHPESVHAFRALHLENEYLKCSVLPDLGGHIYTCIDKISGQPMFYANPSIKEARRSGIVAHGRPSELNSISPFAQLGHRSPRSIIPTSECRRQRLGLCRQHRPRLRHGMECRGGPPSRHHGSRRRCTLSNRSDLRHRFYWWSNAGVQVWDDSRIPYPMQFTATHGFKDIDTWPVDSSGKDLSLISIKPMARSRALFTAAASRSWASESPHRRGRRSLRKLCGSARERNLVLGRRRRGAGLAQDSLDNDSAYVEVQGGLFRNQETYAFLEPGQTIHFSEFWMPVRYIGSITYANLHGVLALTRTTQPDGKITLAAAFNANQKIPSATIKILDGTKNIYKETVSLNPARTWLHKIANLPANTKYTFVLMNAQGKTLLQHTEDTYDLDSSR